MRQLNTITLCARVVCLKCTYCTKTSLRVQRFLMVPASSTNQTSLGMSATYGGFASTTVSLFNVRHNLLKECLRGRLSMRGRLWNVASDSLVTHQFRCNHNTAHSIIDTIEHAPEIGNEQRMSAPIKAEYFRNVICKLHVRIGPMLVGDLVVSKANIVQAYRNNMVALHSRR